MMLKGIVMKSQVLSLLWGVSLLATAPAFGMQPEPEPEKEKSMTVVRKPVVCKTFEIALESESSFKLKSPLEIFSPEIKISIAKNLSIQECVMMKQVCKRWYNSLSPYEIPFSLSIELVEGFQTPFMQINGREELNLENRKLSLLYSPKNMTSLDNPFLLCSFFTPPDFTTGCTRYSLSSNQPVSYFSFHGEPNKFFIQRLPMDWMEKEVDLRTVSCSDMEIDLSSLKGKKLSLQLCGSIIPHQGPLMSCSLSDPSHTEPEEKKLERLVSIFQNMQRVALQFPHILAPLTFDQAVEQHKGLSPEKIKEILEFEGLRSKILPEILSLREKGMNDEYIGTVLNISGDLIKKFSDNQ